MKYDLSIAKKEIFNTLKRNLIFDICKSIFSKTSGSFSKTSGTFAKNSGRLVLFAIQLLYCKFKLLVKIYKISLILPLINLLLSSLSKSENTLRFRAYYLKVFASQLQSIMIDKEVVS